MMLGEKELVKLFPDFADLVQPSGIDLELDRIYVQKTGGSLIDNEKELPELEELEGDVYTLKPHTAYLASIKRKIKMFMIYNHGEFDYLIKSGDRIAQAVVFPVEGSGEYDGSYQEVEE